MSERPIKNKSTKRAAPSTEAAQPTGPGDPMDTRFVEQLAKLMASNDLNTIELRDGERRVMLRRGPAETISYGVPAAGQPGPAPAAASPGAGASASAPAAVDESSYLKITSPMPGTFYAAPKPGEKPFVNVGTVVDEETVVCTIEAMKTFSPHKADCSGTIVRVVAEDGKPVEYGSVLFLVRPS